MQRLQAAGPATSTEKGSLPVANAFHALTLSDQALVEVLADFNVKDPKHLQRVAEAASRSSFGAKTPAQLIGVLMWLSQYKAVPTRFVMYLKTCFDADLLSEEAVRAWHFLPAEETLATLPPGASQLVGVAQVTAMKASAKPFMDWLDQDEEEEEESGSEEEED